MQHATVSDRMDQIIGNLFSNTNSCSPGHTAWPPTEDFKTEREASVKVLHFQWHLVYLEGIKSFKPNDGMNSFHPSLTSNQAAPGKLLDAAAHPPLLEACFPSQ